MAKEKDDVTFTFDPTPIINGFRQIGSKINGFKKSFSNMAGNVSKGVINAAAKIGLLRVAFKGVQAVLKEMPEVGKTFDIAKNIFMRNLLFPLRKAVMPWLQKLLDWVRNNRGMFVKWGATLANIFNSVVSAVQKIIEVGKEMLSTFIGFINRVFGTNIKNLTDIFNILTFKLAVVLTYVQSIISPLMKMMEPLIDLIGIGLAGAWQTATSFLGGFFKGLEGISTPINNIMKTMQGILNSLFSINEEGHSLQTIFGTIGEILGGIIKFFTEIADSFLVGFAPMLEEMMTPLGEIFNKIKGIIDMLFTGKEALEGWKDIFKFLGEFIGTTLKVALDAVNGALGLISDTIEWGQTGVPVWLKKEAEQLISEVGEQAAYEEFAKRKGFFGGPKYAEETLAKLFPGAKKVDDAIIKPDGQVIKFNPNDTIFATKSPIGGGTTINVDFSGMMIQIANASQQEATLFAESIVEQIKSQLNKEFETTGD